MNDSIQLGRARDTFVMTPEWVVVAPLSPQAKALYTTLLAHVNRTRGDGVAWPGMDALAELLGYARRQSIGKYLEELRDLGAVDVAVVIHPRGRRNIYTVHELPPGAYAGPLSLADFYAAKRTERQVEGGSCATAHHGSCATAHHGSCATAHQNQMKLNQMKLNQMKCKDSPPARHRADARRVESEDTTWAGLDEDDLIDKITDHVEEQTGRRHGIEALVGAMIGRGEPPVYVLNTALKAARTPDA